MKPWVEDRSLGWSEFSILAKKDLAPANNKGMLQRLDIFVYLFPSAAQETFLTSHKGKLFPFRYDMPTHTELSLKAKTSLRILGPRINLWNGANLLLPRAYLCPTRQKRCRRFRLKVCFLTNFCFCVIDPFFSLAKGARCNTESVTNRSPKSAAVTLPAQTVAFPPLERITSEVSSAN